MHMASSRKTETSCWRRSHKMETLQSMHMASSRKTETSCWRRGSHKMESLYSLHMTSSRKTETSCWRRRSHTDGNALDYAHDEFKKDRDIVLTAVSQHGCALQYAFGATVAQILNLQDQQAAANALILRQFVDEPEPFARLFEFMELAAL